LAAPVRFGRAAVFFGRPAAPPDDAAATRAIHWHAPSWQVLPAAHGVLHPPQFIASDETSTQDEPQQTPIVDEGVTHV
jgi:hypothetical protein